MALKSFTEHLAESKGSNDNVSDEIKEINEKIKKATEDGVVEILESLVKEKIQIEERLTESKKEKVPFEKMSVKEKAEALSKMSDKEIEEKFSKMTVKEKKQVEKCLSDAADEKEEKEDDKEKSVKESVDDLANVLKEGLDDGSWDKELVESVTNFILSEDSQTTWELEDLTSNIFYLKKRLAQYSNFYKSMSDVGGESAMALMDKMSEHAKQLSSICDELSEIYGENY